MMPEQTTPQPAVPNALVDLLHAATDAELTAQGPQRRHAFRITRYLLAGARLNGITYENLGEVLGVSAGSIRNRTVEDGPVRAIHFANLAGVTVDELTTWHDEGLLGNVTQDPDGHTSYLASDLVHALLLAQSDPGAPSRRLPRQRTDLPAATAS